MHSVLRSSLMSDLCSNKHVSCEPMFVVSITVFIKVKIYQKYEFSISPMLKTVTNKFIISLVWVTLVEIYSDELTERFPSLINNRIERFHTANMLIYFHRWSNTRLRIWRDKPPGEAMPSVTMDTRWSRTGQQCHNWASRLILRGEDTHLNFSRHIFLFHTSHFLLGLR